MPLKQGSSKGAFSGNVSKEMHAGKPQKQALAIAYSVQRKNKRKKMADGGALESNKSAAEQISDSFNAATAYGSQKKASGGEINFRDERRADADDASDSRDLGMLKKADGGQIPLEHIDADSITSEELDMIRKSRMEKSVRGQSAAEPDRSSADKPSPKDERAERMLHQESDDSASNNPKLQQSKLAYGGEVEISFNDEQRANADNAGDREDEDMLDDKPLGLEAHSRRDLSPDEEEAHSPIDAIMQRRYMGGPIEKDDDMADMHQNSREEPNNEDDMSFNALRKENYSEDAALDALDQPADSNMKSPEHDPEDEHDMIEKMRSKIRSKRGL